MDDADVHVQGGNPGCGDLITIYLRVKGNLAERVTFVGEGCTISQAAASVLTELAQGRTLQQLKAMDHRELIAVLGEEVVHTRPRCATLALDVLKAALQEYRKRHLEESASNAKR